MPSFRSRLWTVCFFIQAAFVLGAGFFILPAGDDWGGLSPIRHLGLDDLLPSGDGKFWRPFETILRAGFSSSPEFIVPVRHLIIAVVHILSGWLLWKYISEFTLDLRFASLLVFFFLLNPSNLAALWSLDSVTQVLSTFFGFLSFLVLVYFRSWLATCLSLALVLIAVFWKESALGWFFASPVLLYLHHRFLKAQQRQIDYGILVYGVAAVLLFSGYFIARTLLSPTGGIGEIGTRYMPTFNLQSLVSNSAQLVGISLIPFDTVAFFGQKNEFRYIMSLLACLPFLVLLRCASKHGVIIDIQALGLSLIVVMLLIAPNVVLASVSEMYAYQVTLALVLLFSFLLRSFRPSRLILLVFAVGLLAFGPIATNKWVSMYESGMRAKVVGETIRTQYTGSILPEKICLVRPNEPQSGTYSVFLMGFPVASDFGRSMLAMVDWASRPAYVFRTTVDECLSTGFDTFWVRENSVYVHLNGVNAVSRMIVLGL